MGPYLLVPTGGRGLPSPRDEERVGHVEVVDDEALDSAPSADTLAGFGTQVQREPVPEGLEAFELLSELGSGAMGTVYRARDRATSEVVALKVLHVAAARFVYMFRKEFRALSKVRHPNVVALGELHHDNQKWFFTMELVDGRPLARALRWDAEDEPGEDGAGETIDHQRLRRVFSQLIDGVAAIHSQGLIHRDLKPSNVLLTDADRPVILDFGIIRDVDADGLLTANFAAGTPAYMAPEQGGAGKVGPEADLYAIGVMLFESMTGVRPYIGQGTEVLRAKLKPPALTPTELGWRGPPEFEQLVMALLNQDPSARPTIPEIEAVLRPDVTTVGGATPAQGFVGRRKELDALAEALLRAESEGLQFVSLTGEPGIGKSAIAAAFISGIPKAQPRFRSRCYERERVPFKAFDGLCTDLVRALKRMPEVDAALLMPPDIVYLAEMFPVFHLLASVQRARARAMNGSPTQRRLRAFQALMDLLRNLAADRPTVIFIDDIHWADADSIRWLEDLVRHHSDLRVLVVATERPSEHSFDAGPSFRRVEVGALSDQDATLLWRQLRPDETSIPTGVGHPLFMRELAQHPNELPEGSDLLALLWHRIEALDPGARDLLISLALLGGPADLPLLNRVLEARQQATVATKQLLWGLELAHLATGAGGDQDRRFACFHDRVREAVDRHLAPSERSERLDQLADLVTDPSAEGCFLVARLRSQAGSDQRAADAAAVAGALATATHAFSDADEWYRYALEHGVFEPERHTDLQIARANVLALAGRAREAANAYQRIADNTSDENLSFDSHKKAASLLFLCGDMDQGEQACDRMLATYALPPRRTGWQAVLAVAWTSLLARWDEWVGTKPVREPDERDIRICDAYGAIGASLGPTNLMSGADFVLRSVRLARRLGTPAQLARSLYRQAHVERLQGYSIERTLAKIARAKQLALRIDDHNLFAQTEAMEAAQYWMESDLIEAERRFEDPVRHYTGAVEADVETTTNLVTLRGYALVESGDVTRLRGFLELHLASARQLGDVLTIALLTDAIAVVEVAADRPMQARQAIETSGWPRGRGSPTFNHASAATTVALYTARPEDIDDAIARLDAVTQLFLYKLTPLLQPYVDHRRALLWLKRSETEGLDASRLRALRRMTRRLRRNREVIGAARADLIHALVQAAVGAPDAIGALQTALHASQPKGLKLTSAAIDYRLHQLGGSDGALARGFTEAHEIADSDRLFSAFAPGIPSR